MENKKIKCKAGQGKLNRLASKAQVIILGMGHSDTRFRRDYDNGTATYTCAVCGLTSYIDINAQIKITGTAMDFKCTNKGVENAEN